MKKRHNLLVMLALLSHFPLAAWGCEVQVIAVGFGVYYGQGSLSGRGEIRLSRCPSALVQISLDTGLYADGNVHRRQMQSERMNIHYNLYQDAGHRKIWGDGSQAALLTVPGDGRYPIYALIPAGQRMSAGRYRDNVMVVVEW